MTNVNTTPPVENQMKLFEDVVPVWLNGLLSPVLLENGQPLKSPPPVLWHG